MEEFHLSIPTERSVTMNNLRISVLTEHGVSRDVASFRSLHTHCYAEIFVCTESVLTIVTGKGHYQVRKGCGILVPPRVLHYLLPSDPPAQRLTFGLRIHRCTGDNHDLYTQLMKHFWAASQFV